MFVSKLDSNGNFVWADRMGGTGWSQGMSIGMGIAVAADGSVYTTGSFQGTADFGLGAAAGILTCAGDTDVFVSKLDSAGNFVWARDMGGPNADYGAGIAVAADGSRLHHRRIHGHGQLQPRRNLHSRYRRLPPHFRLQTGFRRQLRLGPRCRRHRLGPATGIALVADGGVYTTGGFWGTADFDPAGEPTTSPAPAKRTPSSSNSTPPAISWPPKTSPAARATTPRTASP